MKLKVVSPLGVFLDEEVSLVRALTPFGQIELLPGHCTYIGIVSSGNVEAITGGKTIKCTIGDGTLECSEDSITILTESATEN